MPKAQLRYFKIGEAASAFSDPKSKLVVIKARPTAYDGTIHPKSMAQAAIQGGHIIEIKKTEFDDLMARHDALAKGEKPADEGEKDDDNEEDVVDLEDMTRGELIQHAKKLGMKDKDIKSFSDTKTKEGEIRETIQEFMDDQK